ncbi:transglutaminase domain-containing protein [Allobaculum stercoricanis]|uniref:transglutaminase domain-containing protein n=2 Tax=Allobaculum stercoricanis TaxID=174709 RepID=UPI00036CF613|nr:transglutaminase domain-containing protein [Allobaculum stercoricanis]
MKKKKRRLKRTVKRISLFVLLFVIVGVGLFFKKIPFVAALLDQNSGQQEAIIPSEQVSFEQATQNQPTAVDAKQVGILDYQNDLYIRNLSDAQKQVAQTLVDGMKAGQSEIELNQPIQLDEISELYQRLKLADPELFFLADQQNYEYSPLTQEVKVFHPNYIEYDDGLTIPQRIEQLRQLRNSIIQDWHGRGEYECSVLMNDYLVDTITYQPQAAHEHNLYGALVERQAVCDGYALAYKYLADGLGMDCVVITGSAYEDKAGYQQGMSQLQSLNAQQIMQWDSGYRHAWNAIQIDGHWYYTDVTYNDPVSLDHDEQADFSGLKEAFTNLTWQDMMQLRSAEVSLLLAPDLPQENALDANVFYRNGLVIQTENQARDWLWMELNDHSSRWVNIKVVDPAVFERMQEIASEVLNEYALYDDSLNWDTLQSVKQDQTGVFAIYLDWNE